MAKGFVIAGVASGVGKTSIALGLARLLARAGLRVQAFKVGPDYLDPTYLAMASGRECYNLDTWMCGPDYARSLFRDKSRAAQVSVVEGVMGLFDGARADSPEGSTAAVATLLGLPVVLVVDAAGMAGSIAALVKGYCEFMPGLRVAGIIANRCGSGRHRRLLATALAHASLPPLIGSVGKEALPRLPGRHLGLVAASAGGMDQELLDGLATALARDLDPQVVLAAVDASGAEQDAGAAGVPVAGADPAPVPAGVGRLGVARDQAFHFYYPDTLEALARAGVEPVPFSPLRDTALPPDLDGLWLGGGYPETHARALAANTCMCKAVRDFCASGRVVYAECGGLIYLCAGLRTTGGEDVPMAGVLPARARMLPRLRRLGYARVRLAHDCLWGGRGEELRGHEFHFSELEGGFPPRAPWRRPYCVRYRACDRDQDEGFERGNLLASYVHLHPASQPRALAAFVNRIREQSP